MSKDRKKPGVAFWTTVGLVVFLLLCAYGGAYARMMSPIIYYGPHRAWWEYGDEVVPTYDGPGSQEFWREFFGPANWLDRRIRPKYWTID